MALSLMLRAASAGKGCSQIIISQQMSRLSNVSLQNAARIKAIQPVLQQQTISKTKTPILNMVRNSSAAVTAQASGSNTTLWIAERVLSVALIGLVPAAIACPSKPLDILMAVSLVAHTYWGFEAVISEYVRVILFGPLIPKLAHGLLIGVMVTTLGGLFYLIFNDIGLAGTIRRFWAIKPRE